MVIINNVLTRFIEHLTLKNLNNDFLNLFGQQCLFIEEDVVLTKKKDILNFIQNFLLFHEDIKVKILSSYEDKSISFASLVIERINEDSSKKSVFDIIFIDEENETKISVLNILKINKDNINFFDDYKKLDLAKKRLNSLLSLYTNYSNNNFKLYELLKLLKVSQFEYSPASGNFSFLNNKWDVITGDDLPITFEQLIYQIIDNVYSYDLEMVRDALTGENINKLIKDDIPSIYIEFRILTQEHVYMWIGMEISKFKKINGEIELIGYLKDIENIKQRELEAIDNANKDSLTNFYNKGYTKSEIEKLITKFPNNEHALLFFDIDNLKHLNDNMGHALGDIIIEYFSKNVFDTFRSSDVFGRIGGDEFVIFMQNITNSTLVVNKIETLMERFSRLTYKSFDITSLSCSIGISLYPKDGNTYEELVEKADKAMYYSKEIGKNSYSFYSDCIGGITKKNLNKRWLNDFTNLTFFEKIFTIFYDSTNFENTIKNALELIGRKLSINRVCIYLLDKEGNYSSAYEWNEEKTNQVNCISNKDMKFISRIFNKDKFHFCNDLTKLNTELKKIYNNLSIISFFQFLFIINGDIVGMFSAESSATNHIWLKQEIYSLLLISRFFETKINF